MQVGEHTEDVRLAATRLVRGINVLGLPAISIPCGIDRRGLPLGLQIIGRPFEEALILRVAASLEDATR
jgi:aspartyl-tRNA(Asn)/glutamyl-tRNA(Gln) amidotransferase subunit A